MSRYDEICREACPEGCGNGIRVNRGVHEDFDLEKDGKTIRNYRAFPCTAPDRDTVIDQQAKEIAVAKEELKGALESLDIEIAHITDLEAQIERRRQDREDDKRIISGLREAMEKAEHAKDCTVYDPKGICNCVKAALAAPAAITSECNGSS